MSKSIETIIQCPFYIAEDTETIMCEGIVPDTVCTNKFSNKDKKREYEKTICSKNLGKKCEHYRALKRLYDLGDRK